MLCPSDSNCSHVSLQSLLTAKPVLSRCSQSAGYTYQCPNAMLGEKNSFEAAEAAGRAAGVFQEQERKVTAGRDLSCWRSHPTPFPMPTSPLQGSGVDGRAAKLMPQHQLLVSGSSCAVHAQPSLIASVLSGYRHYPSKAGHGPVDTWYDSPMPSYSPTSWVVPKEHGKSFQTGK